MKRILVVGGTGFLGYHIITELLRKNYEVTALGLPPAPSPNLFPAKVKICLLSIDHASDQELYAILKGHDGLVFAAGMDDRKLTRTPAYPIFFHANVDVPARLFTIAAQTGVKRSVVLGSYFTHFNRTWPEMKLAMRHPYIRSRVLQEETLVAIPGLETCVLELPYIFGAYPSPGWKPLWTPLINYLRQFRTIFYMYGGTACISSRVAARATVSALERGKAGSYFPIGQENLSWIEMLTRLAKADGRTTRVIPLPTWMVKLAMQSLHFIHTIQGKQSGLDLRFFSTLQTANTYIDPQYSQTALGFDLDDLDEAFSETVKAIPLI